MMEDVKHRGALPLLALPSKPYPPNKPRQKIYQTIDATIPDDSPVRLSDIIKTFENYSQNEIIINASDYGDLYFEIECDNPNYDSEYKLYEEKLKEYQIAIKEYQIHCLKIKIKQIEVYKRKIEKLEEEIMHAWKDK